MDFVESRLCLKQWIVACAALLGIWITAIASAAAPASEIYLYQGADRAQRL